MCKSKEEKISRNGQSPVLNTKLVKERKRDKVTELSKEIMINVIHKLKGSIIIFW